MLLRVRLSEHQMRLTVVVGMQQDMFDKGDEQAKKKAKSGDGSESFEAARVLQHPCREQ